MESRTVFAERCVQYMVWLSVCASVISQWVNGLPLKQSA